MSVDKQISLSIIKTQIEECSSMAEKFGWIFSPIDEENQLFFVEMTDYNGLSFHIEIKFDNYQEIPLLIEFVNPVTGEKGTKQLYPKSLNDSFFHGHPCICNPASRKAYKEFDTSAPHGDWKMIGWQSNPQTGELKNLQAILKAIYIRINNTEKYAGTRMA